MNRNDADLNEIPGNVVRLSDRLAARPREVRATQPAIESEERQGQRQLKADYAVQFSQLLTVLPDAELRDRAEAILGLLPSDHADRRHAVSQLFDHWKSDFRRRLGEKQNKS
jgi:hypothetical protein